MFLNCNETFLTSFALDDLLNKLVAGVCEKRPVSSREVLELMSEILESSKMKQWYYGETVRSFKNSVDTLNRRGFPMQMTCPLYFRVPLEDGGVDELFPSGSQVAVTPNNFDAFDMMLKQYYLYRSNPDVGGTYYDAVRRFLPISAQRNLLNSSFSPIIKFLLEHVLNPDSPWLVRSEEEWARLEVTYDVPLAGRCFPVDPTKPAMTPVPFDEASRYVEMASDTVNKLNNLLKTGAALSAFRTADPSVLPPLMLAPSSSAAADRAAAEMKLSPPSTSQHQRQQQPQPATSRVTYSSDEFAEFVSIGLRRETCQNMTAAEKSFWDYILRLRRNPAQIEDVSFRLEFGGEKYIDLKANGAFIPVTKYNVDQFIEAAVRKQQEVHRYINEIASTTTTTTSSVTTTGAAASAPGTQPSFNPVPSVLGGLVPTTSNAALARTLLQGQEGGGPGGQAQMKVPTKPRSRTTPIATAGNSSVCNDSVLWNEVRLRRSDMDSAVVRSMLGLRALYNESRLTAAELSSQNLRFCLPCEEGVYNLIPNGREIKVGLRNFGEFIVRLEEEKRRVEAANWGGMDDVVLPLKDDDKAFWTDRNILEIWTYEVTTDLLAKSGLPPEEVVQQTKVQWDTHFLRNADDPQNLLSGPQGEILPSQLHTYLELLHRRLQTVRLAILDARKCSKQASDVDGDDNVVDAGFATTTVVDAFPSNATPAFYTPHQPRPIPPPPTEEDLNMFSPAHNTGDLLAPPQSFNH